MPNSSTRSCPFIAGPMIDDPARFVGRREELNLLTRRMDGAQPTSVNVIGERRIGKSSLLYHFFQTWEQRVNHPARFAVVYLDLQARTPATESAFYRDLAWALRQRPAVQRVDSVHQTLLAPPRTSQGFADVLEQCTNHVLLPVFCLDEFEVLLRNKEQFTDSFFDQLRGWMNASQLMFILSSRRPLDVYAGEQNLTSAFFNLGQTLPLGEFTEGEADELVSLPMFGRENLPALPASDQRLARSWGGRHPYLLQLAAEALFEARQAGKSTRRAKRQFEVQRKRVAVHKARSTFPILSDLRAVLRDFPRRLGSLSLRFGQTVDDTRNAIIGAIIILLVLACVLGYIPIAEVFDFIRAKIKP